MFSAFLSRSVAFAVSLLALGFGTVACHLVDLLESMLDVEGILGVLTADAEALLRARPPILEAQAIFLSAMGFGTSAKFYLTV